MGIMKNHFGRVGKYDPWYWITLYLLCRDRSAAARRCACFLSFWMHRAHLFGINIFLFLSVACAHTKPVSSSLFLHLPIPYNFWRIREFFSLHSTSSIAIHFPHMSATMKQTMYKTSHLSTLDEFPTFFSSPEWLMHLFRHSINYKRTNEVAVAKFPGRL